MIQCVKFLLNKCLRLWFFTVWLFYLSPKCNLSETFYQVRALRNASEVEDIITLTARLAIVCCVKLGAFSCGLMLKSRWRWVFVDTVYIVDRGCWAAWSSIAVVRGDACATRLVWRLFIVAPVGGRRNAWAWRRCCQTLGIPRQCSMIVLQQGSTSNSTHCIDHFVDEEHGDNDIASNEMILSTSTTYLAPLRLAALLNSISRHFL